MTIDKTLKVRRGANQNRSVLTRPERIEKLKEADRWDDDNPSALGLPKVRVLKLQVRKKKKKKEEEDGDGDGAAES